MLIIKRQETLKNAILLIAKQANGQVKITNKENMTIIEDKDGLVGINFFNVEDKLETKEGVHSVSEKQIEQIKTLGYEIKEVKHYFKVGKVLSRTTHPKSERLFLLEVDIKDEKLQIVTNSLNSTEGKNVVVATLGATLPSGLEIVESKVMGVESQGMLCGAETLQIGKSEGVYIPEGNAGDDFKL